LSEHERPKRPIQPFRVWMLIALVIAVAVFAVAVVGPSKVLCTVEGGHYSASSDTCFIPQKR
jgi:hypothetical protein